MATLRTKKVLTINAETSFNKWLNSLKVGYATNFNRAGYNAYVTYNTNIDGMVKGVDYDGIWSIIPETFPSARLDWFIREGAIPNFGVWGYGHVDYRHSASFQLTNLNSLVTSFDWEYTGSKYFNLLCEVWLARSSNTPVWSSSDALFEIGLFCHAENYNHHNGGVQIGTTHNNNGILYSCRRNSGYITFAPLNSQDVLHHSFDWRAAFDYLIFHGVLTGSEWLSGAGPLFGIEPTEKPGNSVHGGAFIINSLSTSISVAPGASNADYPIAGVNVFPNSNVMTGWDLAGLKNDGFVTDMDGGVTAVALSELATNTTHGFLREGAFTTVDSREMDYILFEDFKIGQGRTKFRHQIADTGFVNQILDDFDTTTLTNSSFNLIGTGLTRIGPQRQMIALNLSTGWYRTISVFRKAAGITQIFFTFLILNDAGESTYLGVAGNGVTARVRHRLIAKRKIVLSGTPEPAITSSPYSFTPTTSGGISPLVYSFAGTLPSGWSINTATGQISGTTSSSSNVIGTIQVAGSDGTIATLDVNITLTTAPLTTWDTGSAASGVTFSENNRRITATAGNLGARSTSSRLVNSGTQAEIEVLSVSGGMNIGLGNSSAILDSWFAQNANGIALNTSNGNVSAGGNPIGPSGLGPILDGERVAIILLPTGGMQFKRGTTLSPVYTVPSGALYLIAQPNLGSVRIHTEANTSTVALEAGCSRWN